MADLLGLASAAELSLAVEDHVDLLKTSRSVVTRFAYRAKQPAFKHKFIRCHTTKDLFVPGRTNGLIDSPEECCR